MPPKGTLGLPPTSSTPSPAALETAKSVLQNLANATEHEEVAPTTVRAEPVQTQLEATQGRAEPTAPATIGCFRVYGRSAAKKGCGP